MTSFNSSKNSRGETSNDARAPKMQTEKPQTQEMRPTTMLNKSNKTLTPRIRRHLLIDHLIMTPYRELKKTVANMPREQVKRIWTDIEPSFKGVGLRSGYGGPGTAEWTSLYRKMALFDKEDEEEAP